MPGNILWVRSPPVPHTHTTQYTIGRIKEACGGGVRRWRIEYTSDWLHSMDAVCACMAQTMETILQLLRQQCHSLEYLLLISFHSLTRQHLIDIHSWANKRKFDGTVLASFAIRIGTAAIVERCRWHGAQEQRLYKNERHSASKTAARPQCCANKCEVYGHTFHTDFALPAKIQYLLFGWFQNLLLQLLKHDPNNWTQYEWATPKPNALGKQTAFNCKHVTATLPCITLRVYVSQHTRAY